MDTKHQHDLSANVVHLDYKALERTASIAVHLALEELSRELGKWRVIGKLPSSVYTERMLHLAEMLCLATDTQKVLEEGREREDKLLVNYPEIMEMGGSQNES